MNWIRRSLDRMQGNLTMASTIVLGFLVIFLPLAVVFGWYGITRTNDALRTATEANLITFSGQVRDELERALIRPYQDIQTLANNEIIRSSQASPEEKRKELLEIQSFYNTIQAYYSVFLNIALLNAEGRTIASTNSLYDTDWSQTPWFEAAKRRGQVVVSPPHYAAGGAQGEVVMDYTAPVRDKSGGAIIGVVIGQMNMRTIWEITEGATLGKEGFTRIIAGDGTIYAPRALVFQKFTLPEGASPPQPFAAGLDTYKENGETMVAGYISLNENFPNWYVWVSQPYDEAFGPIQNTVRNLMIGALIGLFLFVTVSVFWIWRAMRPLRDLSTGAEKIGGGELAHRVPVTGPIEIRRLSTSFNEMAASLEKAESLRAEHKLLRGLQSASMALAGAISPAEIIGIISNGLKDLFSADFIWILLADRCDEYLDTKTLILPEKLSTMEDQRTPSAAPFLKPQVGLEDRESLIIRTFISGEPHFLSVPSQEKSVETDPHLGPLVARCGTGCVNIIPLMLPGKPMGIIVFGRANGKPLADEEKRIALVFAHEASISLERARLHVQEIQNAAELTRLNNLKSRLLYILSHELKTPLTSLRTSARLLHETDAEQMSASTQERLRGNILRATERLMAVADDIYPIANILTSDVKVEPRATDCRRLVTGAVDTISHLTKSKRQTVTVSIEPSINTIWADKDRLREALARILSNASKFSPNDSTIEVTVRKEADKILFQVRDQGIGISEKDQRSIFDGFYQADSEAVRRAGGRGLGLLFAKTVIERHGGRIWVESELGRGSTFSFAIPNHSPI